MTDAPTPAAKPRRRGLALGFEALRHKTAGEVPAGGPEAEPPAPLLR